jgi:hypothetical protein
MIGSIQGMGGMRPMGGMPPPEPLTDEQKTKVQDLLSNYDASNMTAEDAKTLFKSFQEAGIRGPGLREAIESAGFDAEALWSLGHDGQKPPQPPSGLGPENDGKINSTTLKTLQDILNQYDLSNLSSDQQDSLMTQLNNAGLIKSKNLIDLSI